MFIFETDNLGVSERIFRREWTGDAVAKEHAIYAMR